MAARTAVARARVALVACGKAKLPRPAPARELYASALFRLASGHAAREYDAWYVLSAEHGLVAPDQVLAPYDRRLGALSAAERYAWGERVAAQLLVHHGTAARYDLYAGAAYRNLVIPELERAGAIDTAAPLRGLRIGQQLAWLRRRASQPPHTPGGAGER